jgi:2-polyprenyl-3-methyl-5-hydroxy-6-metoxy-1,4-benzoquinol methylase
MKKVQTAQRNSGMEAADNVIHHRHVFAYREASKRISGLVLEIGSGEGYGLKMLSPMATTYFAYDKHPTPIAPELKNVVFRQALIPPLEGMEDASVDFVVSFQVIEHIKKDRWFLEEAKRVLRPGGMLILTTPNIRMSLTRNPWHIREYTPAQMEALLTSVFPETQLMGVYGNEKVMKYHEANRASVRKFTRFDILNMQYWLPRWMLRIPYDLANRMNRNKLHEENNGLVAEVVTDDFYLEKVSDTCLDFFAMARK